MIKPSGLGKAKTQRAIEHPKHGSATFTHHPFLNKASISKVNWKNLKGLKHLIGEARKFAEEHSVPLKGSIRGINIGAGENQLSSLIDLSSNRLIIDTVNWEESRKLKRLLNESEEFARTVGLKGIFWGIRESFRSKIPKQENLPEGWELKRVSQGAGGRGGGSAIWRIERTL